MAAVDYFLEIDGIKGESHDHKKKDWIDLESWSWGETQTGSHAGGGGAGVEPRHPAVEGLLPALLVECQNESDRVGLFVQLLHPGGAVAVNGEIPQQIRFL